MIPGSPDQPVIAGDIHKQAPGAKALFPYLSEFWRDAVDQTRFKGPTDDAYPPGLPTSIRPDSRPENGGRPGTIVEQVRPQVLDPWNVEVGILNCAYGVDGIHNPYGANAFARAANDWQIEHWLEKEPRRRASIVVPVQHPDMAAAEIHRVGSHPGFVQVLLPARAERPYGNRRYLPISDGAMEQYLVVSIQFGGSPGVPPTPGRPTVQRPTGRLPGGAHARRVSDVPARRGDSLPMARLGARAADRPVLVRACNGSSPALRCLSAVW